MHLLIYCPAHHQAGHPYSEVLHWETAELSKECHADLESFGQRLRVPNHHDSVVVLMPENQAQLEDILTLGPLLEDLPLTVVLPSRDPVLVGRAHLLRPRFLTYQDQDPALLLAVLTNIAHRGRPGPAPSPEAGKPQPRPDKGRGHLRTA
ncbi:MAG: hypothetical protein HY910_17740 [Desulfarculus sp.]|nr:hypothetical protein [Desulfarculus sp.]